MENGTFYHKWDAYDKLLLNYNYSANGPCDTQFSVIKLFLKT